MIYFSSDWHLQHKNIIKYDNRPFKDVDHMDQSIMRNCAEILTKGDTLYYLGDLCFGRTHKAEEALFGLSLLEIEMFFIKGNHDKKDIIDLYRKYGTYLGEQAKITALHGQEVVLNHYAMRVWDKSHRGVWHLYGHSHHSLPDLEDSLSFDVGCNGWDYKPISFDQVAKKMERKTWKPIDHHTVNTNE